MAARPALSAGISRKSGIFHGKNTLRFMPTYRLDPKRPLNKEICEIIIKNVMESSLEEFKYDSKMAVSMCKTISEEIKLRIKMQNFDRYRYVCVVTIGERLKQGYVNVCKFLWDAERDYLMTHVIDRPDIFAVATVYATYYD